MRITNRKERKKGKGEKQFSIADVTVDKSKRGVKKLAVAGWAGLAPRQQDESPLAVRQVPQFCARALVQPQHPRRRVGLGAHRARKEPLDHIPEHTVLQQLPDRPEAEVPPLFRTNSW